MSIKKVTMIECVQQTTLKDQKAAERRQIKKSRSSRSQRRQQQKEAGAKKEEGCPPRTCAGGSTALGFATPSSSPSWGPRPTYTPEPPGPSEKRATGGGSSSRCGSRPGSPCRAGANNMYDDYGDPNLLYGPGCSTSRGVFLDDTVRAIVGKASELAVRLAAWMLQSLQSLQSWVGYDSN